VKALFWCMAPNLIRRSATSLPIVVSRNRRMRAAATRAEPQRQHAARKAYPSSAWRTYRAVVPVRPEGSTLQAQTMYYDLNFSQISPAEILRWPAHKQRWCASRFIEVFKYNIGGRVVDGSLLPQVSIATVTDI
jgi:hypothetical protein